MNDELLIELVSQHPAIYDVYHTKYNDSDFKNNIWQKIGGELGTDGQTCKTRWSNIRDNYRKSLKKINTKISKIVKPYKYSEQLAFLTKYTEDSIAKIIDDKSCEDGVHPGTWENSASSDEDENGGPSETKVSTDLLHDPLFWKDKTNESPTPCKKRKQNEIHTDPNATFMQYIISKIENEGSSDPHPVDAFLAGMAPALKKLSLPYWHYAKEEIFQTVHKYEMKMLIDHQQHGRSQGAGRGQPPLEGRP